VKELLDPGDASHWATSATSSSAAGSHALSERRLDDGVFIACGLAWGAGLIHVQAAIEHSGHFLLFTAFFALLAAGQFLWGIAAYRCPAPKLLAAGAALSLSVVAVWVTSRTTGLPLGPTRWRPEPVGLLDSIASADEALLALIIVLPLRSGQANALMRGSERLANGAGLGLILLSSLALVLGGHAH
jgi:hypothetical protein